jgi:hypothetical protein
MEPPHEQRNGTGQCKLCVLIFVLVVICLKSDPAVFYGTHLYPGPRSRH